MLGYLLGAYVTSITLGLVIVFTLHGSSSVSTSKHTISPAEDVVVGLLALLIAFVLATGRDRPLQERRARGKRFKEEKQQAAGKPTESLPIRLIGRGSPRITFAVGVVLSFPGVSYLTALHKIDQLNASVPETALLVIVFCLIQQLLLEFPLFGYFVDPDGTQDRVERFKVWMARSGRGAAVIGAAVIGLLLLIRGLAGLIS